MITSLHKFHTSCDVLRFSKSIRHSLIEITRKASET